MRRKRIAGLIAGLSREYQQCFARGMAEAAASFGIDLCIFNCQGLADAGAADTIGVENRIFDLPDLSDFDGIAALTHTFPTAESRRHVEDLLVRSGVAPQVVVDADVPSALKVTFDDNNSLWELMAHLLEQHAYRRFAMITGPVGNSVADNRSAVCMEAIRTHGAELPENRIFDGKWSREGGYQAADALLAQGEPLPEVIICGNDDIAFGVYDRLEEADICVPDQVCVTGFDARREAVARGLTTISRPVEQAGAETVRILHDWMNGKAPKGRYISLPTELVLGDSCRCTQVHPHAKGYVRMLGTERQRMEQSLVRASSFSSTLAAVSEEHEIGAVISHFASIWGAKELHVCIAPDLLTPNSEAIVGYPAEMKLLASYTGGDSLPMQLFPTSALAPILAQEHDKPLALVFSPLYYLERTFGYAVFDLEYSATPALFAVNAMLSSALMNLRLQSTIRAYAEALQTMSEHDPLTDLYNRRGYMRIAPAMFEQARTEGRVCALISVDMDGMKQINDRYGHYAGDAAIVRMGQALRVLEGRGMTCVHISGDEFVAIGMIDRPEEIFALRALLVDGIAQENAKYTDDYRVAASIGGYAAIPVEGDELDEFLRHADRQMYEDKRTHPGARRSDYQS